jgi:hypothetical protein
MIVITLSRWSQNGARQDVKPRTELDVGDHIFLEVILNIVNLIEQSLMIGFVLDQQILVAFRMKLFFQKSTQRFLASSLSSSLAVLGAALSCKITRLRDLNQKITSYSR